MAISGATPARALRITPYAASVFAGALLLFLIQPMAAKQLLPRFGGGAAVWSACLMFFQIGLLLGYVYADWSARRLAMRMQVVSHIVLVALGAGVWASSAGLVVSSATSTHPVIGILRLLALTIGAPYF